MTPNDIEILLHCHVSPKQHPRINAPAVREAIECFLIDGIIEKHIEIDSYKTTALGRAWVKMICETPYPEVTYTDPRAKEV